METEWKYVGICYGGVADGRRLRSNAPAIGVRCTSSGETTPYMWDGAAFIVFDNQAIFDAATLLENFMLRRVAARIKRDKRA